MIYQLIIDISYSPKDFEHKVLLLVAPGLLEQCCRVCVVVILGVLLSFDAMAKIFHFSEEINEIIFELVERECLDLVIKLVGVDPVVSGLRT